MMVKIVIKNKLEVKNNSLIEGLNWNKTNNKRTKNKKNEHQIIVLNELNKLVYFNEMINKIGNNGKWVFFFYKKNDNDNLEIKTLGSMWLGKKEQNKLTSANLRLRDKYVSWVIKCEQT